MFQRANSSLSMVESALGCCCYSTSSRIKLFVSCHCFKHYDFKRYHKFWKPCYEVQSRTPSGTIVLLVYFGTANAQLEVASPKAAFKLFISLQPTCTEFIDRRYSSTFKSEPSIISRGLVSFCGVLNKIQKALKRRNIAPLVGNEDKLRILSRKTRRNSFWRRWSSICAERVVHGY